MKTSIIALLLLSAIPNSVTAGFGGGGFVDISVINDRVYAFGAGYSGMTVYDDSFRSVWDIKDSLSDYDRFYHPSVSLKEDKVAIWARDETSQLISVFDKSGVIVSQYGPYDKCGYPEYDGEGILWFAADGSLYCDGEDSGIVLDAASFSISSDTTSLVYGDKLDRIIRMELISGNREVISDERRFYAPRYISDDAIIAPSIEGEIWLFDNRGGRKLADGSQPSYCPEPEGILFVKSEDDGERVTSSDIWFISFDGTEQRVTITPSVIESHPKYLAGGIISVNTATGELVNTRGWW